MRCAGSRYEGEWSNGCHHGYGVYTWLDGRRYEGQWDYNKKEGVGTYYFGHEGCAYTGHWEDGYRHGQGNTTQSVGVWWQRCVCARVRACVACVR